MSSIKEVIEILTKLNEINRQLLELYRIQKKLQTDLKIEHAISVLRISKRQLKIDLAKFNDPKFVSELDMQIRNTIACMVSANDRLEYLIDVQRDV